MRLHFAIWLGVLGMALAGCSKQRDQAKKPAAAPASGKPRPERASTTRQTPRREVLTVRTAEEFVAAVGPDRVIKLAGETTT